MTAKPKSPATLEYTGPHHLTVAEVTERRWINGIPKGEDFSGAVETIVAWVNAFRAPKDKPE